LVQIYQREGRAQPLVVFPDAAIAHLGKSEDSLQDAERMLHLRPDSGLGRVLAPGFFVYIILELGSAAGPILRPGRGLMNCICLPLITRIALTLYLSFYPSRARGWDLCRVSRVDIETEPGSQAGDTDSDPIHRLRNLEALKQDGLISEDEFRRKREEVMQQKW
jgi:Short C-terminal domain